MDGPVPTVSFRLERVRMAMRWKGLALSVLATGCISAKATLLNPGPMPRAALCPEAVVVYQTEDQVPKPFAEIALLRSSGDPTWATDSRLVNSMRKKTASLGANGVVLKGVKDPSVADVVLGEVFYIGADRSSEAVAIFVPADSAKSMEICGEPTASPD